MSNTFGNFVEAKNGSFGIEKSSTRHESPITIGDVLFVRDRRPVVTFVQISYPHEVAHLAKTVIKQLFTSVKKEKTLLPMVGEARRTSPVCYYCGSVNPMDLEFCNKCGFALR